MSKAMDRINTLIKLAADSGTDKKSRQLAYDTMRDIAVRNGINMQDILAAAKSDKPQDDNAGKSGAIEPGIYRDMRFDDYLAVPAMSASKLKLLYKSHRDFVKGIKSTASMGAGRLEHLAVLEGKEFEETTVVTPQRRTNEKGNEVGFVRSGEHWRKYQQAHSDKLIITAKEFEQCTAVADCVAENPHAVESLIGEKEVSIFWNDPVFGPSKMRCDCLNTATKTITDLKRTASPLSRFGYVCDDLGYDIQAFWYIKGANLAGLDIETFAFVAYESSYPHDSTVQQAMASMLDSGSIKVMEAAKNIKLAEKNPLEFHGKFPGVICVDFPLYFDGDL